MSDNPPIRIYVNKIENIITFEIKTRHCLELLTSKAMKLVSRTKNKITEDENRENVPRLEITQVVLVHRNIAKKDYQHDSKFLCTFAPNKSFGELLDISPQNFIFPKTFISELSYIEV